MLHKPVIILSAPRSGSTLLFEILSSAANMWTIGDESHATFESIPELQIEVNQYSNRLTELRATPEIIQVLHNNFLRELRDRDNNPARLTTNETYRLLEKTPKNSLRVPFINKAFPDATYIYLVRDPYETISSIMEAWRSDRWITYPNLPDNNRPWSLLLPPDWQKVAFKPLEYIAAFQWISANQYIIDDLNKLTNSKIVTVSYAELINDTSAQIKRICDQADIEYDDILELKTAGTLPHSRYTQTAPRADKWKKNERELGKILPQLKGAINKIDRYLRKNRQREVNWYLNKPVEAVSRNSPCPCGSGKKYKQCHGKL